MKNVCFIGVFSICAVLATASSAHAQVPVIDSSSVAEAVSELAQDVLEVAQLQQQYAQLKQQYQMFTNPTNILGMAQGLESQGIENSMPSTSSMENLVTGNQAVAGLGQQYYNQNSIDTPDNTPEGQSLQRNAQAIANIQAMATNNLQSLEQREQDIPQLEQALNSATSITQVSAITGRIQADSQFVQAQQAQAANLEVLSQEQQASEKEQDREQFNSDQENAQIWLNGQGDN